MATNITDLVFDDGAVVELNVGSSSAFVPLESLDFQEDGIMYEFTEAIGGVRKRVFRPYGNFTLTQTL